MYCRACGYKLVGLPAGPCPECAAPFDPAVPASFRATERPLWPRWFAAACVLVCTGPLAHIALIHLALVGARITLGRWPNRMGADDPHDLTGLGFVLYCIAMFSIVLMPASLGAGVIGLVAALRSRNTALGPLIFVTLLASWFLTMLMALLDPAQAIVWFRD